uniref:Uncharacterized protein n=1 Tax=Cannabis sativa TaxID=3483 RepID=A0A803R423_CANSA
MSLRRNKVEAEPRRIPAPINAKLLALSPIFLCCATGKSRVAEPPKVVVVGSRDKESERQLVGERSAEQESRGREAAGKSGKAGKMKRGSGFLCPNSHSRTFQIWNYFKYK